MGEMLQTVIFGIMGGLGLFFLGIRTMSDGLQKYAGDRLRNFLKSITKNRVIGMLTGLFVTAIIQSSSATTVMTVSLVNAGLINLVQAIGVVLGANIGTTVTAQMIAFKVQDYALPLIGVGVVLKLFAKREKLVYFGEAMMGFGLLFFGLSTMKDAFAFMKGSEAVFNFFANLDGFPFVALIIGTVFTMMMQSSSVTVGITMALASTGLISFPTSVALILGDNIGTTITAELASIGTNVAAKRTARAHTMFNVIGVIYIFLLMPYFIKLVNLITPGEVGFVITTAEEAAKYNMEIGDVPYAARHIANAHTMFNVVNNVLFLPMIGVLAKISTFMIPGEEVKPEFHLKYLGGNVVSAPSIAIGEARDETIHMAKISLDMLDESMRALFDGDMKRLENVRKMEDTVDMLQREITDYSVRISQESITPEISREITSIINMVNNIERIGDHCENLTQLIERKKAEKLIFSDVAIENIREIYQVSRKFLDFVINSMETKDIFIKSEADRYEKRINYLEDTFRNDHVDRLNKGNCQVDPGLIFIDMLTNFEKIGDHTFNIAEAVVGIK
ncbi:MAG: Na/Pi cotransporter family protein [Deltaproteobacteria bacterium]|uniref:Na/Pi cotransporter family protein n=1 Tax=Candidatus Zymogenus saltonus TaxID=2844893 RepID=A0A9D8KFM3_9DELT|nr:Na/Pi cotransporter family protein [Candidatus Zymogenus saltonus]